MQSPTTGVSNPALTGITQGEAIILNEKAYNLVYEGFEYCAPKCVRDFSEEGLPYHPGEKACLNRCLEKLKIGTNMGLDIKKKFQADLAAQHLPYAWMRDVANNTVKL